MKPSEAFVQLSLVVDTMATSPATPYMRSSPRAPGIEWGDCDFEGSLPIQCATLPVPLDYTDPTSDKILDLSLIKVAAQKTPPKGSILFNFGGPGYEAVHTMGLLAEQLQL